METKSSMPSSLVYPLQNSQYSVMRYSKTTDGELLTANLSVVEGKLCVKNYILGSVAFLSWGIY